ncbi:MAG: hypothetical protein OXF02_05080 [Simkaniaceae bacterium]|nr:hypothetical protein [Simkaniaceae bacterium]
MLHAVKAFFLDLLHEEKSPPPSPVRPASPTPPRIGRERDRYVDPRPYRDVAFSPLPPPSDEGCTDCSPLPPSLPLPTRSGRRVRNEGSDSLFGLPFADSASSGTDIGLTPHPQLVMVKVVDDCTHTMAVGRTTIGSIIVTDHKKQGELEESFCEQLRKSIAIAKRNRSLDYVKEAIRLLTPAMGCIAGAILTGTSVDASDLAGIASGVAMTALGLGSTLLNLLGKERYEWLSGLMASGIALLTIPGGLVQPAGIFQGLMKGLGAVTAGVEGATNYERRMNTAAQKGILRKITGLRKERQQIADDVRRHYKSLNISDSKHLFNVAFASVDDANRSTKNMIQNTL